MNAHKNEQTAIIEITHTYLHENGFMQVNNPLWLENTNKLYNTVRQ